MWQIEWTTTYIISQIFVIFAMIALAITYFIKSEKWILLFNCASSFFFAVQYFVIGAYAGTLINLVSIIRGIWLYADALSHKKHDLYTFFASSILCLAVGVLTNTVWWDVIAVAAGLLLNYALWDGRVTVYRWLGVAINICWIAYNALAQTLLGLVCESAMFFVQVGGVFALYFGKHKVVDKKCIKENL